MAELKKNPLPKFVLKVIKEHQKGGITEAACRECSAPCCSAGGFAILENVELIYDMYKRGELRRADYEFQPDLSFEKFVLEHFDVWIQGKTGNSSEMGLMNFFMKSISADKNLISIPGIGGDYYEARTNLFRINPWLSKGCVFLSQKISREPVDSLKTPRHCILHTADCFENLTAKPIDCLFHTCETTGKGRVVSEEISKKWLSALESSFPNSVERFQTLIGHKIGEMKDP